MNPTNPAPESVTLVDLLLPDLLGQFRGKRIAVDALHKVYKNGIYLPASVFALDINGSTVEATGLGYDQGDGDRLCMPAQHSVSATPWQTQRGQLLMSMYELDHRPFFADPRHVLQSVLDSFRSSIGLQPVIAIELEFYLLDPQRKSPDRVQAPIAPGTGQRDWATQVYSLQDIDNYEQFLHAVHSACAAQNIPTSGAVAEYAPGQFEINLQHQPEILAACDQALLLKRTVRAIAHQHGFVATFMPKPHINQAGNGMHVHISLLDKDNHNALNDDQTLHHAIAGLLATMHESILIFAPTINAYRRLQPMMYAPTAPTWGYDNRSTALRIPSSEPTAKRIEHRVAGADTNPYLLAATLLAGIQYGIEQRLNPPPATRGNAYQQNQPQWPKSLDAAIDAFRQGDIIANKLGDDFSRLYATCRQADADEFMRHLTRIELDWYLGI